MAAGAVVAAATITVPPGVTPALADTVATIAAQAATRLVALVLIRMLVVLTRVAAMLIVTRPKAALYNGKPAPVMA